MASTYALPSCRIRRMHRAERRFQRGLDDAGVKADAMQRTPLAVLDLDIARRGRVSAPADRMLVIVDERELDPERLLQRVDESVDRAVAFAFNRHDRAVSLAQRRDELAIVGTGRNRLLLEKRHRRIVDEIGFAKQRPQVRRGQFLAVRVHSLLRDLGKLDLQRARKVQVRSRLQRYATPPLPDWLLMRMMAS